jgi:hypothetical protein
VCVYYSRKYTSLPINAVPIMLVVRGGGSVFISDWGAEEETPNSSQRNHFSASIEFLTIRLRTENFYEVAKRIFNTYRK